MFSLRSPTLITIPPLTCDRKQLNDMKQNKNGAKSWRYLQVNVSRVTAPELKLPAVSMMTINMNSY